MKKQFTTSVYVINPNKWEFLLVFHKRLKKWVEPGGHVEEGESLEEAALREVKEETGLDVKLLGNRYPTENDYIIPFAVQKRENKEVDHIHVDFIFLSVPENLNSVPSVNDNGVADIGWFNIQQIEDESFETFDDVRVICRDILDNFSHLFGTNGHQK